MQYYFFITAVECTNKNKTKPTPYLLAQGANGANNGSSRGKRGHKSGGDGKNALGNRENLFHNGNNLLLEEVLLLGFNSTEVHFICRRVKGSKGGYVICIYYIF